MAKFTTLQNLIQQSWIPLLLLFVAIVIIALARKARIAKIMEIVGIVLVAMFVLYLAGDSTAQHDVGQFVFKLFTV